MPSPATRKTHRTVSNSLTRVVTKGERVVVHRRGKAVAALIPLEDLALLEELEDQKDVEEYRNAKQEWERDGRQTTTPDDVVKELGIRT
jgi:antitoxin (DNA-binding transcriptional repressor) of toxin-antitoxin stability system